MDIGLLHLFNEQIDKYIDDIIDFITSEYPSFF
jgi:hypothetical protein